jgi:hypothetical protein
MVPGNKNGLHSGVPLHFPDPSNISTSLNSRVGHIGHLFGQEARQLARPGEDRPGRIALGRHHYCTAAIGLMRVVGGGKNDNYINHLDGYDTILTCLDAVSMVRAALEGDGRHFPSTQASFRV